MLAGRREDRTGGEGWRERGPDARALAGHVVRDPTLCQLWSSAHAVLPPLSPHTLRDVASV